MRKLSNAEIKVLTACEKRRTRIGLPILFPDERPKGCQDATIKNLHKLGLIEPVFVLSYAPVMLTEKGKDAIL